jgi:beta-glucosidase
VKVKIRNASQSAGDEVVELYIDRPFTSPGMPFRTLQGFRRVHLNAGESQQITFSLAPRQLAFFDENGELVETPGTYTIAVGGHQPTATPQANNRTELQQTVTITGNPVALD